MLNQGPILSGEVTFREFREWCWLKDNGEYFLFAKFKTPTAFQSYWIGFFSDAELKCLPSAPSKDTKPSLTGE